MRGKIRRNYLFQLLETFSHLLLPIITFPYVSRMLGPERIGQINFIDLTAQFFILLGSFGIPLYGIREVARYKSEGKPLQPLIAELFTISFLLSTISTVLFAILISTTSNVAQYKKLFPLAIILILFSGLSFDWLLKGFESFRQVGLRSLIFRLLILICTFSFVHSSDHFERYYAILVAGVIGIRLYDLYFITQHKFKLQFSASLKKHWKPLLFYMSISISIGVYSFMDAFLLGIISGSVAVGLYATAYKIIVVSQGLVRDISSVLLPHISALIIQNNHDQINKLHARSMAYIFSIAIPMSICFFIMSPEIINIAAGSAFLGASGSLRILAFLPVIVGYSTFLGNQVMMPFGKENKLLLAVGIGSISSIATCLILCPYIGSYGAAIASLVAELLVMGILYFQSTKLISVLIPWRMIAETVVATIPFIVLVLFARSLSNNPFIISLIALPAGGLAYALIQYFVFMNSFIREQLMPWVLRDSEN